MLIYLFFEMKGFRQNVVVPTNKINYLSKKGTLLCRRVEIVLKLN